MAPRIPAELFETRPEIQNLTPEQEALKRQIYEKMRPSRRKFIDRIGYEHWDPFQEPNHPLDMRVDAGMRTTQQLMTAFLQSLGNEEISEIYRKGALDCAMGLITKDEKYRGVFDFCLWYYESLQKPKTQLSHYTPPSK
ncbi:MAG: hypothetical protein IJU76_11565 [Desulfovibrionaceae bacterium]|nr:hypothetical protein [Desulfovibrionaceae bacterium]